MTSLFDLMYSPGFKHRVCVDGSQAKSAHLVGHRWVALLVTLHKEERAHGPGEYTRMETRGRVRNHAMSLDDVAS